MLGAIKRITKSKGDVIAHTVKSIQNPPTIMQHRSKRDREREEQLKAVVNKVLTGFPPKK